MVQEVVLAVDPHKASNTLVVLNHQGEELERARFANTATGHRDMRRFGARWPRRVWAVEGSHGMGRALAQRLVAEGDTVFDVPAKLAARVRVLSVGHGRKTDPDDATSVGIAALHAKGLRPVTPDDSVVALRLLSDRRTELVALRTQAVCRLHRLLAELRCSPVPYRHQGCGHAGQRAPPGRRRAHPPPAGG
jgi:transposase